MSESSKSKRLNILPEHSEVKQPHQAVAPGRFPSWLHRKLPQGNTLWQTQKVLNSHRLPTVCEEAKCPNLLECWSNKTATFLTMGSACTRNCGFCDIDFSVSPKPLDPEEPHKLAISIQELGLKHAVITMVARDDLPDGGAAQLAAIIHEVRHINPGVTVEVLTSDFSGNFESLQTVLDAAPEIFNHNIETVRALTPRVRHKATYERTLSILRHARTTSPLTYIKSGLMLGLGEEESEVKETIEDLYSAGCQILTLGQYLQPNRLKLRVKDFINPEQFETLAAYARTVGIQHVYAGPFVRSSYNAAALFTSIRRS